jgi:hypothetical protein
MNSRPILAVTLVATLAVTAWLAMQDADAEIEPVPRSTRPAAASAPAAGAARRAAAIAPASALAPAWPSPPVPRPHAAWSWDAASARAWSPPAPTALAAAPRPVTMAPLAASAPAPLVAPAFPYQLLGRVDEADVSHALLAAPGRTLGVRASDVLDGQWRIDAVDARGLAVTWLPGGQRLQVPFRSS